MVALSLARAAAYAGNDQEAVRLAAELRREIGNRPGVDETNILNELGRIYALVGARNEALDCLRTLVTGPSANNFGTPRVIRIDPCWSRIAADPRFEEILKSAKPL